MGSCDADSAILSNRGMGVRADSEDIAGTGEGVSEMFHHNRVQHAIAEHEQRGDLRGRKWRPCKVQNIEEVRVPFSVEWREVQGIESDRVGLLCLCPIEVIPVLFFVCFWGDYENSTSTISVT